MGVVQQQTVLCLLLWSHFGMKHESSEVIEEALIWFMNGTGNETKRPFCQHVPAKTALRWRLWNYLSDFPSHFFEETFQWFLKIEARYARNLSYWLKMLFCTLQAEETPYYSSKLLSWLFCHLKGQKEVQEISGVNTNVFVLFYLHPRRSWLYSSFANITKSLQR